MMTIVLVCGFYSLAFAVFHLLFWRIFGWKKDLAKLRPENRAIMQILNLRLIYIFLFAAVMCFAFPSELQSTTMGKAFMAGFSVFWIGRTIEQFIFLRMRHPAVHALTAVFILGSILFALPAFI
jgi:hypothetical protein